MFAEYILFLINILTNSEVNNIALIFQNQWSSVFCGIVSRAMTTEVLSTGVGENYNGALQLVRGSI